MLATGAPARGEWSTARAPEDDGSFEHSFSRRAIGATTQRMRRVVGVAFLLLFAPCAAGRRRATVLLYCVLHCPRPSVVKQRRHLVESSNEKRPTWHLAQAGR